MKRSIGLLFSFLFFVVPAAQAGGGHGPLYAYGTTTNARGQWSLDFGTIVIHDQSNTGVYFEPAISYGITERLMLTASGPIIAGQSETLTPALGSYKAQATWRFLQKNQGIGSRFESAIFGGFIYPAEQFSVLSLVARSPGATLGAAIGKITRGHYFWAGAAYSWFAERGGDQRPGLFSYSIAYAYRPVSWRKDYPAWDWRLLVEGSGEQFGDLVVDNIRLTDTDEHQFFLGPSILGQKRSFAIECGLQVAVYRNTGLDTGERFRFGLAGSYFF